MCGNVSKSVDLETTHSYIYTIGGNHAPRYLIITMKTKTENTTSRLAFTMTKTKGKEKTVVKIKLHDDFHNGHEDFSLTCDIYEHGRDVGGGCAHGHILKLFPELAPFADLHLSDYLGRPMHAAANALYWINGTRPDSATSKHHGGSGGSGKKPEECRAILQNYLRTTGAETDEILAFGPRTADEVSYLIQMLEIDKRWKKEAAAAIQWLEEKTGETFQSKATRHQWEPIAQETIAFIEDRRASGYYEPEQVAARATAAAKEAQKKRVAAIRANHAKCAEKAERQLAMELFKAERMTPDQAENVIYYDHTRKLSFNWRNHARLWTREEFEAFSRTVSSSDLPEGVTLEFNKNP